MLCVCELRVFIIFVNEFQVCELSLAHEREGYNVAIGGLVVRGGITGAVTQNESN